MIISREIENPFTKFNTHCGEKGKKKKKKLSETRNKKELPQYEKQHLKKKSSGNSLVVQWLGFPAFTAKGAGSIPPWSQY